MYAIGVFEYGKRYTKHVCRRHGDTQALCGHSIKSWAGKNIKVDRYDPTLVGLCSRCKQLVKEG